MEIMTLIMDDVCEQVEIQISLTGDEWQELQESKHWREVVKLVDDMEEKKRGVAHTKGATPAPHTIPPPPPRHPLVPPAKRNNQMTFRDAVTGGIAAMYKREAREKYEIVVMNQRTGEREIGHMYGDAFMVNGTQCDRFDQMTVHDWLFTQRTVLIVL